VLGFALSGCSCEEQLGCSVGLHSLTVNFLSSPSLCISPTRSSEALTALVFHGAHVLDEVQLGLGGVVTEHTVVIAAFTLNPALVMLKVL